MRSPDFMEKVPVLFTDSALKKLLPAAKRTEIADPKTPGLQLRLHGDGGQWSVKVRAHGQRKRVTLGPFPAISVSQARKKAGDTILDIKAGGDPALEAKKSVHRGTTLEDALAVYNDAKLGRMRGRSGQEAFRALRYDFAPLMPWPVGSIDRGDVMRIITAKATTAPVMANRLLAYARPFWRWLQEHDYVQNHILKDVKLPTPETARERVLNSSEIAEIWEWASAAPYPFGPWLRLLMATAQRVTEVAEIQRSEIDFEARTWSIPGGRTKNAQPHIVHLSALSFDAIEEAMSAGPVSDLLFTTTGRTPISGFSRVKARIDQETGVKDWRFHDLRRTAVSAMADAGVDPAVADKVINHVGSGSMSTVQRIYQRSAMLKPRQVALEKWAHTIERAVHGDEARVLSLK